MALELNPQLEDTAASETSVLSVNQSRNIAHNVIAIDDCLTASILTSNRTNPNQTRTKSLVTLQKKVIRIIKGQKWNDHTQPIFEELGIMKFDNLNTYLIGLFTYKVVYNLIPSPVSNYFTKREQVHAYSLRASGNLSIQFSRTNYRKHALTCRGPIIWNNIPKDIRNILVYVQFKSSWRCYMQSLILEP